MRPGFVKFPLNPKLDWGRAASDARHIAVINATYELPLGAGGTLLRGSRGLQEKLIHGWTLSGVEPVQSGFPFTPQLGFNPTNNGDSRNPIRPSWNPDFSGRSFAEGRIGISIRKRSSSRRPAPMAMPAGTS